MHTRTAIPVFHTGGAAKALTGSYVAGDLIDFEDERDGYEAFVGRRPAFDESTILTIAMTLAATAAPTSVQARVMRSSDGGTTFGPVPAINSVLAGVIECQDNAYSLVSTANGLHWLDVPIIPGFVYRVDFKATGGTDPTLLAVGALGAV